MTNIIKNYLISLEEDDFQEESNEQPETDETDVVLKEKEEAEGIRGERESMTDAVAEEAEAIVNDDEFDVNGNPKGDEDDSVAEIAPDTSGNELPESEPTVDEEVELDEPEEDPEEEAEDTDVTPEDSDDGDADSEEDSDDEAEEAEEDSDEDGDVDVEDPDLSTTEEEVEEAEDEAEEAEEEAEEIEDELEEDSKVVKEIEEETASVEEYIELLKAAVTRNKREPLFMITVNSKLTKLNEMFGKHSPSIPSLESYGGGTDVKLYYTCSLESMEGFLSRLKTIKKTINLKIVEATRSWSSKKIEPRVEAINKKVDNLLSKLTSKPSDFKVAVSFKNMDVGGKDILPALNEDLKNTTRLIGSLLKPQLAIQKQAGDILLATGKADLKKLIPTIKEVLKVKPLVIKDFNAYAFTQNFNIVRKDIKESKPDDNLMDVVTKHLLKSAVKMDAGDVKKNQAKAVIFYSKDELVKILLLCKVFTALATKVKKEQEPVLLDISTKIAKDYVKALDESFYKMQEEWNKSSSEIMDSIEQADIYGAHAIYSGVKELNKHSTEVYKFILTHALFNAEAATNWIGRKL